MNPDEVSEDLKQEDWLNWFFDEYVIQSFRTGSSYTCDPPVTDTDVDLVLFVHDMPEAELALLNVGYLTDSSREYEDMDGSKFVSLRNGPLNLIVTDRISFFEMMHIATQVAKALNLRYKVDRIKCFETVDKSLRLSDSYPKIFERSIELKKKWDQRNKVA